MPLPDHQSSEAIILLQEAVGHVTVDGIMNQQTIGSFQRLDLFRFRDHFAKFLAHRHPDADDVGSFAERVIARVPENSA